jgi:hypothetical protein
MAELDLTNIAATSISTPGSGVTAQFADLTNKRVREKNDAGFVSGAPLVNFSTTSQAPTASTRTYIVGSAIAVPASKLQIGSIFRWRFNMTKTAFGSATSTIDVCVGTAGTTADTARVSFTKPAGTAAIDEAYCEVEVICRGPLSASGVFVGEFTLTHNGNTAGHATIPSVVVNTVSGTFDVTTANLIVGLCITTGAADVITIQQVTATAFNL